MCNTWAPQTEALLRSSLCSRFLLELSLLLFLGLCHVGSSVTSQGRAPSPLPQDLSHPGSADSASLWDSLEQDSFVMGDDQVKLEVSEPMEESQTDGTDKIDMSLGGCGDFLTQTGQEFRFGTLRSTVNRTGLCSEGGPESSSQKRS